jgi:hypothetical protein
MASLIVAGNTSGTVTLQAPDVSGSTVLTLPTTSGTIVTTGGGASVPFAAGSAASPSITFTGDTNTGIFSPGADTIGFAEGGAEIARFDSSGNFGIGVTSVSSGLSGSARVLGVCDPSNLNLASLRLGSGSSFASGNRMEVYSSAGTCGVYGQDNIPMLFSTNATERMRINASGQITTPFQPAFFATMGSNQTLVSQTISIIQLNSASVNRGSHFNTGTYTFTAPVAGVYAFSIGSIVFPPTSDSPVFYIRVNGNTVISLFRYERYNNISTTPLISLSANDAVTLHGTGANGQNSDLVGGGTYFTGWLLG